MAKFVHFDRDGNNDPLARISVNIELIRLVEPTTDGTTYLWFTDDQHTEIDDTYENVCAILAAATAKE